LLCFSRGYGRTHLAVLGTKLSASPTERGWCTTFRTPHGTLFDVEKPLRGAVRDDMHMGAVQTGAFGAPTASIPKVLMAKIRSCEQRRMGAAAALCC